MPYDAAAAWAARLGRALGPAELDLLGGLDAQAARVLAEAFAGSEPLVVTRDRLTGLLTRPVLEEAVAHEIASSARHGAPCLLVADLDGLTDWMRAHGHLAGDLLVVRTCEILARSSRRSDVLGRLGVDQLAVMLPRTDLARGLVVARRFLARALADVRQHERSRPGSTLAVPTLSVALGHLPEPRGLGELLEVTDAALQRARRAGGGVVEAGRIEDVPLRAAG